METYQKEQELIGIWVEMIQKKILCKPKIGLVLGSGLGDYADQIEDAVIIPYSELPGFPASTVSGHKGQLVIGIRNGKQVIAMQGRVHFYEGGSQRKITMSIRLMKRLGVERMVLTNAAGGVNLDFKPGTLMLIRDHINYSGSNPLIGENWEEDGPRFPDVSSVYPEIWRKKLKDALHNKNISLAEGVYMMFSGPCYETPSEVKMARTVGADAVGMSTVPESIVCAHCGIPVIGISCITNLAAGISDQPLDHKEVVDTADKVKAKFVNVINTILEEVF